MLPWDAHCASRHTAGPWEQRQRMHAAALGHTLPCYKEGIQGSDGAERMCTLNERLEKEFYIPGQNQATPAAGNSAARVDEYGSGTR